MSSEFERAQLWRQALVAAIPCVNDTGEAVTVADELLAAFDARFPLPPVGKVPAAWPPVADGEDE